MRVDNFLINWIYFLVSNSKKVFVFNYWFNYIIYMAIRKGRFTMKSKNHQYNITILYAPPQEKLNYDFSCHLQSIWTLFEK